jgi:hypothetical protein
MENILTFVWAEHSPVCRDASTRPVGCYMHPMLTNTCLVIPLFKHDVRYPVGSVTKKLFSCQWNKPFSRMSLIDQVSFVLSSALLFKIRYNSLTLQFCAELCHDHQTVTDWSQFCHKAMSYFISSSLQLFLWWLAGGGIGKIVGIDESCFSWQVCNWGRLHATAWVFVDVKRELGHLSWHCCWSLRRDIARYREGVYPTQHHNCLWLLYVQPLSFQYSAHTARQSLQHFVAYRCSQIWSRPHGSTSTFTSGLTEEMKLNLW